jgi:hypothetical protein
MDVLKKNSMQLQWIQKVGVGGLEKKKMEKPPSIFCQFFLKIIYIPYLHPTGKYCFSVSVFNVLKKIIELS